MEKLKADWLYLLIDKIVVGLVVILITLFISGRFSDETAKSESFRKSLENIASLRSGYLKSKVDKIITQHDKLIIKISGLNTIPFDKFRFDDSRNKLIEESLFQERMIEEFFSACKPVLERQCNKIRMTEYKESIKRIQPIRLNPDEDTPAGDTRAYRNIIATISNMGQNFSTFFESAIEIIILSTKRDLARAREIANPI